MYKLILLSLFLPALAFGQINKKQMFYALMSSSISNPAREFIQQNARAAWNFNQTGTITTVPDITGNGYDLTGVTGAFNFPSQQFSEYRFAKDNSTKNVYKAYDKALYIPAGHGALFHNNHETHIVVEGRSFGTTVQLFGVTNSTRRYRMYINNTTGNLHFETRWGAASSDLISTSPIIVAGNLRKPYSKLYIRLQIDFDANTVKVWVNGALIPMTLSGYAIANWSPTYYPGTDPFGIGGDNVNNNGTTGSNEAYRTVHEAFVTDILTDEEAELIEEEMIGVINGDFKLVYNTDVPALSTYAPLAIGIRFPSTPARNVDVTVSGTNVTTINATLTPTQCTNGYLLNLLASTANVGRYYSDVTISAVGYNSQNITVWVSSDVEDVNTKWTPYLTLTDGVVNWRREYPTFTDVTSKRNALRTDIFGSTSLPTGAPYSVSTQSAVNTVTLDNANGSTGYELDFRQNDPDGYYWENPCGYQQNISANTTLVIDFLGHGENGHDELYNAIMDAGYDYASAPLAYITNNPLITLSFPTSRHNQIWNQGIDRVGFDGRQLFVFHIHRLIDYALTQKAYTKIILVGVSGGGQMAALAGALDPRINKVFCNRGSGAQAQPFGNGDGEQGMITLFDYYNEVGASIGAVAQPRTAASLRNHSRLDWYMMKAADGGDFHHMSHANDDCCWKGWYNDIYYKDFQDYITANGFTGNYYQSISTDAGEVVHGYQPSEITYIIANL